MRIMGRCYQELQEWAAALKVLREAASEAPETREPWHDLALCCYRTSRWAECLGAALTCLSIENREKLYTVDPAVWGSAPHDLASIAAWNLGQYTLALEHARKAVDLSPDDIRLRKNLEFCESKAVAA
jgi:Flp pilus assembly protein TadD